MLAKYEPDWREVIDAAGGCRFDWVMNPGQLSNISCYTREQTATITAQIVLRDWAQLKVPEDMTGVVDDTSAVLRGIASVDLKTLCGDGAEPSGADACNTALGTLNMYYGLLDTQLDAWRPYL